MGEARSRFQWYADGTRLVFAVPGSVPGSTARTPWVMIWISVLVGALGLWMAFSVGQDILTGTPQGGTIRHYASNPRDRAEIGSALSAEHAHALLPQAV